MVAEKALLDPHIDVGIFQIRHVDVERVGSAPEFSARRQFQV